MHILPASTFMRTVRVVNSDNAQASTVLFDPQGDSRVVLTSARISQGVSGDPLEVLIGFGTLPAIGYTGITVSSAIAVDIPTTPDGGTIVIGDGGHIIGYGAKDASLTFSCTDPGSNGVLTITVTGYQEDASCE